MEDETTNLNHALSVMLDRIRALAETTVTDASRHLNNAGIRHVMVYDDVERFEPNGPIQGSVHRDVARVYPSYRELFYSSPLRIPKAVDKVAETFVTLTDRLLEKPGVVILGVDTGALGFALDTTDVRVGLTSEADAVIWENMVREEQPFSTTTAWIHTSMLSSFSVSRNLGKSTLGKSTLGKSTLAKSTLANKYTIDALKHLLK